MADPTEVAAESASKFRASTEKGNTIRSGHVSELVREIQSSLKGMTATEHETFLETLASYLDTLEPATGDLPGAGSVGDGSLVLAKEVTRKLNMAPETAVPAEKASLLLTRSLLFMIMVDQLVWGVWKNIPPGSNTKREPKGSPSMPNVLRSYLTGDTVDDEDLVHAFEKTRQLAAGLLGALGPIGRNYGTKAAAKFNPESVREIVVKEGGKGEARYWQKYEELFQDLSEDIVEQDIHRAIVKYTEDLLRGSRF